MVPKYGIPWCPTPIPDDFLNAWVTGQRLTFRVPTQKDAAAQTELQLAQHDGSIHCFACGQHFANTDKDAQLSMTSTATTKTQLKLPSQNLCRLAIIQS